MKIFNYFFIFLLVLTLDVFAVGIYNDELPHVKSEEVTTIINSVNYSLINTNFSQFAEIWLTSQGDLDEPEDIYELGDVVINSTNVTNDLDVDGVSYMKDISADGVYHNSWASDASPTTNVDGTQTVTLGNGDSLLVDSTDGFPNSGICSLSSNYGEFAYEGKTATEFLNIRPMATQASSTAPPNPSKVIPDGKKVMLTAFGVVNPTDDYEDNIYQTQFLVYTRFGPFRIRSNGRTDIPSLIYGKGLRLATGSWLDFSAGDNHIGLTGTKTVLNAYYDVYSGAYGRKDIDTVITGLTDANLLYADAGNDKVGIGIATPAEKLHVVGNSYFDGDFNVTGNMNIEKNINVMGCIRYNMSGTTQTLGDCI